LQLEPMIQESDDYPCPTPAARQRVLEEARTLLSAMIYGCAQLQPADARRRQAEEFQL